MLQSTLVRAIGEMEKLGYFEVALAEYVGSQIRKLLRQVFDRNVWNTPSVKDGSIYVRKCGARQNGNCFYKNWSVLLETSASLSANMGIMYVHQVSKADTDVA